MEPKIWAVLGIVCVIGVAIKMVMTEIASIFELWSRLRRRGGRK